MQQLMIELDDELAAKLEVSGKRVRRGMGRWEEMGR